MGHVLRVLVSAKWREHLSKLWRRTAGGIRLARRHPNRVQAKPPLMRTRVWLQCGGIDRASGEDQRTSIASPITPLPPEYS